jgi:hypothetical protein
MSLRVAAALLALLAVAHSYLGERYILMRLFRRGGLPKLFGGEDFTRRTLRFVWHLTSIAWLGLAAVLLAVAAPGDLSEGTLRRIVAVTAGLSSIGALVGSRGRHLSWLFFLAISLLVWFGG